MTVIEFFGMSRAGKTTQISRLIEILNDEGLCYDLFTRPKLHFNSVGNLERFHELVYNNLIESYERFKENRSDFLIQDRGFYDRMALLESDFEDGRIRKVFHDDMKERIIKYLPNVDIPLLLLVDNVCSINRLSTQREDGLDNTIYNMGLDVRDNLKGLQDMRLLYEKIARAYPIIQVIDGIMTKGEVHEMIIAKVFNSRRSKYAERNRDQARI